MKLFHLSDLHLGKRVNEFSMLEDQKYILNQILYAAEAEKPDGALIAGDVYDKSVPSAEAVALFDDFLVRLTALGVKVFAISGNHDCAERVAFGARLMFRSGVYLSPVYGGAVLPVALRDEYGPVNIWLLPFLKPAQVRAFEPDAAVETYTDAVRACVARMAINTAERNVLVAHQFVTGASRCDSEDVSVGGADNVDAAAFEMFDYAALGHLHKAQCVGREHTRYCGSPLKYSFSEAAHDKSVTVVELREKGDVRARALPLAPLRDMKEIRGSYEQVAGRAFYGGQPWQNDYLRVTLTDEEDIPDAVGKLRAVYPYIMRLDYDNRRTRAGGGPLSPDGEAQKTPLELFGELYLKQNNRPMSDEQRAYTAGLIEKIWGDGA